MSALTDRCLELLPNARLLRETDNGDREVMILGPPGTGKSTSLGIILNAHLKAGLEPDRMLVNAFTRNATAELRRRLAGEYGLTDNEMTWVRTIHSSCFQLLRLRSEQVMSIWLLKQFGEETGYKLQGVLNQRTVEDPYAVGSVVTLGDWCFIAEELRRVSLRSHRENWSALRLKNPINEPWSLEDAKDFSETYRRWKREHGLYDFTDMLELVLEHEFRPPVNWIWLDEVQDMTPLQWKVIDLWAREARRLFSHGDLDQCIFAWSGANPASMQARDAHRLVLSRSYRLPTAVHAYAQRIIKRVRNRIKVEFEPHREGGSVETVYDWAALRQEEGTKLLLVRNRAFADGIRGALIEAAVPFKDRTSPAGIPDPEQARGQALAVLLDLHAGQVVRGGRLRLLQRQVYPDDWPKDEIRFGQSYSLVDLTQAGATDHLVAVVARSPLKALRMEAADRSYLEAVLRRHGAAELTRKPATEISTIHGAKGEEADFVAVSTAMTRRTRAEYEEDPDSEERCYYVAATRAKDRLTLVVDGPGWELVR